MIDLHLHTEFSDGTDSIDSLIEKLIQNNVKVFSITDHDNVYASCVMKEYKEVLKNNKITYISGVEYSTIHNGANMHILAYGYDSNNRVIEQLNHELRELRLERIRERIIQLREKYGIILTEEEIQEIMSYKNPSKPHIANILVKKNLATSIADAFDKYLKDKVKVNKLSAAYVVKKLADAGVVVGIAHPLGGEGEPKIPIEVFEQNIKDLKPLGLSFVECYYSLYGKNEINQIKKLAKKYGLALSGGSDYHGKNKNIELGNCGNDYIPSKDDFTILNLLRQKNYLNENTF